MSAERLERCFTTSADDRPLAELLAVHQPVALIVNLGAGQSAAKSEHDLLEVAGHVCIAGKHGSGRSHLLRWIEAKLRERGTRVIRARSSEEFAAALASLYPPTSPDAVRAELLNALDRAKVEAQQRLAESKERELPAEPLDRDAAGWLAQGLRDLFTDPITGEAFLRADRGAFARLAANPDSRFEEADFLRPDGIRFLEASRPAQAMLTKLNLVTTNQFRAQAVRLMNQLVEARSSPPAPAPEPAVILVDSSDGLGQATSIPEGPFRVIAVIPDGTEPPWPVWRIRDLAIDATDRWYAAVLAYARLVEATSVEPAAVWRERLFPGNEREAAFGVMLSRMGKALQTPPIPKTMTAVELFIRAIETGGASLELLTPSVWRWLWDSGEFERCRIVRSRDEHKMRDADRLDARPAGE